MKIIVKILILTLFVGSGSIKAGPVIIYNKTSKKVNMKIKPSHGETKNFSIEPQSYIRTVFMPPIFGGLYSPDLEKVEVCLNGKVRRTLTDVTVNLANTTHIYIWPLSPYHTCLGLEAFTLRTGFDYGDKPGQRVARRNLPPKPYNEVSNYKHSPRVLREKYKDFVVIYLYTKTLNRSPREEEKSNALKELRHFSSKIYRSYQKKATSNEAKTKGTYGEW